MSRERFLGYLLCIVTGLLVFMLIPKDYYSPTVKPGKETTWFSDRDYEESENIVQQIFNNGRIINRNYDSILHDLSENRKPKMLNKVFYSNVYTNYKSRANTIRKGLVFLSRNVYNRLGNNVINISVKTNGEKNFATKSIRYVFPSKTSRQNVYSIKTVKINNKWFIDGDDFFEQMMVASQKKRLLLVDEQ